MGGDVNNYGDGGEAGFQEGGSHSTPEGFDLVSLSTGSDSAGSRTTTDNSTTTQSSDSVEQKPEATDSQQAQSQDFIQESDQTPDFIKDVSDGSPEQHAKHLETLNGDVAKREQGLASSQDLDPIIDRTADGKGIQSLADTREFFASQYAAGSAGAALAAALGTGGFSAAMEKAGVNAGKN